MTCQRHGALSVDPDLSRAVPNRTGSSVLDLFSAFGNFLLMVCNAVDHLGKAVRPPKSNTFSNMKQQYIIKLNLCICGLNDYDHLPITKTYHRFDTRFTSLIMYI